MRYLLLIVFSTLTGSLAAQDSSFVQRVQKMGREEALRSIQVYNRGKVAAHQREVMESSKRLNETIKIFLKGGLDTGRINGLLESTGRAIDVVKDGIIFNIGTSQTQRNLAVSSTILHEVAKKILRQKSSLDEYVNTLLDFRIKVDSLQGDSAVYSFSSDSVEIVNYVKKLALVAKELSPVDTSLNESLTTSQALQLKVDQTVYEVRSLQEDIDIYSNNLATNNTNKEFPYLWEKAKPSRPFGEIQRLNNF